MALERMNVEIYIAMQNDRMNLEYMQMLPSIIVGRRFVEIWVLRETKCTDGNLIRLTWIIPK